MMISVNDCGNMHLSYTAALLYAFFIACGGHIDGGGRSGRRRIAPNCSDPGRAQVGPIRRRSEG